MQARCKVTGKYRFHERQAAEQEADRLAIHNWHVKGLDCEMNVYPCAHCGTLHVGTRETRPIHPWKPALHHYLWLDNPRPRYEQRITAGNFEEGDP